MALTKPIVLKVNSVGALLQYVLRSHAPPSTLIVCSSKADFLERIQTVSTELGAANAWSTPTLRLLSTSRTLKLAFVPDITHLRAYLATYSATVSKRDGAETDTALRHTAAAPVLVILDPIQLHRPTSAFSAQGLNRTFAAAVEAAYHTGSKLILTECPRAFEEPAESTQQPPTDPWAEDVPILNVTTKRLGELSVGRTVKIRDIAARWCIFEELPDHELHAG